MWSSSPQRMPLSVVRAVLLGLTRLPEKHHVLCLHGGEPLLAGKDWFQGFCDLLEAAKHKQGVPRITVSIQTNGVCLDREWVDLIRRASAGVSLSLDGPAPVHDAARCRKNGCPTHMDVMRAIEMLMGAGIRPAALAVITKHTTKLGPDRFYEFFVRTGISEIDVAPYIETGETEAEEAARREFEPAASELLSFLKGLFDIWLRQDGCKGFLNVRSFEQLVCVLLGYAPTLCTRMKGLACGRTPCVMPDGSVFACDLESADLNLRLGNVCSEPFDAIVSIERLGDLHRCLEAGFASAGCRSCEFFGLCAFACPRFTLAKRRRTELCSFTRAIVEHARLRLNEIARLIGKDGIEFLTQATC